MNSQEAIIELMVSQVFKKHGMKKELDMSEEDKSKLKEVVDQLKSDVDTFVENEKVSYTENSAGVKEASESAEEPSVDKPTENWSLSNNDVQTIKNFVYRKKRRKK